MGATDRQARLQPQCRGLGFVGERLLDDHLHLFVARRRRRFKSLDPHAGLCGERLNQGVGDSEDAMTDSANWW